MLKILKKVTIINFTLAKVSYGLFALGIIFNLVSQKFLITGCIPEKHQLSNCMFRGNDISQFLNNLSSIIGVLFIAGCLFTVLFKIFEILTSQYNKTLNKDATNVAPIS